MAEFRLPRKQWAKHKIALFRNPGLGTIWSDSPNRCPRKITASIDFELCLIGEIIFSPKSNISLQRQVSHSTNAMRIYTSRNLDRQVSRWSTRCFGLANTWMTLLRCGHGFSAKLDTCHSSIKKRDSLTLTAQTRALLGSWTRLTTQAEWSRELAKTFAAEGRNGCVRMDQYRRKQVHFFQSGLPPYWLTLSIYRCLEVVAGRRWSYVSCRDQVWCHQHNPEGLLSRSLGLYQREA